MFVYIFMYKIIVKQVLILFKEGSKLTVNKIHLDL